MNTSIDAEQDRADQDEAAKILESRDRVLWFVYRCLHDARGFRIAEAAHAIAKLAPRKAAA